MPHVFIPATAVWPVHAHKSSGTCYYLRHAWCPLSLAVATPRAPWTEMRGLQVIWEAASHPLLAAEHRELHRGNSSYSPFGDLFFEVIQLDHGSARLSLRLLYCQVLGTNSLCCEDSSIVIHHDLTAAYVGRGEHDIVVNLFVCRRTGSPSPFAGVHWRKRDLCPCCSYVTRSQIFRSFGRCPLQWSYCTFCLKGSGRVGLHRISWQS